jgi:glucose-1-phosphate thymidylyltransferase
VLVKRVDNPLGYGVTDVEDGLAQEISEKPRETKSNIVNTGIYAFTKDIFNFIKQELDIPDVLNTMIAQGCSIRAEEITSTWLDVIYPWDILNLNNIILRQIPSNLSGTIEPGVSLNGPISIGNDTIIRSNTYIAGPAMIGTGCDIGPNVCIMHATSIGDNVVVSPFTQIRNSAIGNDVNIGPGCSIQDSVIDRGCVIQGHFTASSQEAEIKIDAEHHTINIGAMIGEDCHLNSNVVAQPGVIIGNYTRVQALKKISGRLPDHSLVL